MPNAPLSFSLADLQREAGIARVAAKFPARTAGEFTGAINELLNRRLIGGSSTSTSARAAQLAVWDLPTLAAMACVAQAAIVLSCPLKPKPRLNCRVCRTRRREPGSDRCARSECVPF